MLNVGRGLRSKGTEHGTVAVVYEDVSWYYTKIIRKSLPAAQVVAAEVRSRRHNSAPVRATDFMAVGV